MERYEPIVTLGNILTILSMIITATVTIVSLRWRINLVESSLRYDVKLAKTELENKVSMLEQQRLMNKEAILDLRTTIKEHVIKDELWQASIDKRLDDIQTDLIKMSKLQLK